jgi:hypothetical protein
VRQELPLAVFLVSCRELEVRIGGILNDKDVGVKLTRGQRDGLASMLLDSTQAK